MKYHAREAADWTKDILAAYSTSGNGGHVPRRSATVNPFSHQTQANEELNINNSIGRPPATFTRSPQVDTNPVSHHTQSRAETQSIHNSPSPPPPPPKQTPAQITPRRVALGSRGPTKEEQDFMLGEEEEEEGQELENKPISASSVSSPLPDASTRGPPNILNRGDADVAAIRGRDSEGALRP